MSFAFLRRIKGGHEALGKADTRWFWSVLGAVQFLGEFRSSVSYISAVGGLIRLHSPLVLHHGIQSNLLRRWYKWFSSHLNEQNYSLIFINKKLEFKKCKQTSSNRALSFEGRVGWSVLI